MGSSHSIHLVFRTVSKRRERAGARQRSRCSQGHCFCALFKGSVKIPEWARKNKGFEFTSTHFRNAARGRVSVLEWAEENNLRWYSARMVKHAARRGYIGTLDFIHSTGREIAPEAARSAAGNGQVAVLAWMNSRDLLRAISQEQTASHAARNNHINVLSWLYHNGYDLGSEFALMLILKENRDALIWARQRGIIEWNARLRVRAALFCSLPFTQWLQENGCPWDIQRARQRDGNEERLQWRALENDCPTE